MRAGHCAELEAHRSSERRTTGHRRWDRRELVLTAVVREDWRLLPRVRQVLRGTHHTKKAQHSKVTPEVLYGFTSPRPQQASAQPLV